MAKFKGIFGQGEPIKASSSRTSKSITPTTSSKTVSRSIVPYESRPKEFEHYTPSEWSKRESARIELGRPADTATTTPTAPKGVTGVISESAKGAYDILKKSAVGGYEKLEAGAKKYVVDPVSDVVYKTTGLTTEKVSRAIGIMPSTPLGGIIKTVSPRIYSEVITPVKTEYIRGAIEGVKEKPVATAGSFALGLGAGAVTSVGARLASGAPTVIKGVGKIGMIGLGGIYGASKSLEIYQAPKGQRAYTAGRLTSTEIIPFFTGGYVGSKIAGRVIRSGVKAPKATDVVKLKSEYAGISKYRASDVKISKTIGTKYGRVDVSKTLKGYKVKGIYEVKTPLKKGSVSRVTILAQKIAPRQTPSASLFKGAVYDVTPKGLKFRATVGIERPVYLPKTKQFFGRPTRAEAIIQYGKKGIDIYGYQRFKGQTITKLSTGQKLRGITLGFTRESLLQSERLGYPKYRAYTGRVETRLKTLSGQLISKGKATGVTLSTRIRPKEIIRLSKTPTSQSRGSIIKQVYKTRPTTISKSIAVESAKKTILGTAGALPDVAPKLIIPKASSLSISTGLTIIRPTGVIDKQIVTLAPTEEIRVIKPSLIKPVKPTYKQVDIIKPLSLQTSIDKKSLYVIPSYRMSIASKSAIGTRSSVILKSLSSQIQKTQTSLSTPVIAPPPNILQMPSYAEPPFELPLLWRAFGESEKRKKKDKRKKRKYKFTPSLVAVVLGIKGKAPKILSGLEVRPIKIK